MELSNGAPVAYAPTGDPGPSSFPRQTYQPRQSSDRGNSRIPQGTAQIATYRPESGAVSGAVAQPWSEAGSGPHDRRNGEANTIPQVVRSRKGKEPERSHYEPDHQALPAAPDVPRAPPPVSYRGPYVHPGSLAPRQGNPRSFSARARALQEAYSPTITAPSEDSPGRFEPQAAAQPARRSVSEGTHATGSTRVRPTVPPSISSSSRSAAAAHDDSAPLPSRHDSVATSPLSRSNTRKGSDATATAKTWASDRSPLQKLEVKLSDISKEEKRARVELAEQRLREAKARQANPSRGREDGSVRDGGPAPHISSARPERLGKSGLNGVDGSRDRSEEIQNGSVQRREPPKNGSGSVYADQSTSQRTDERAGLIRARPAPIDNVHGSTSLPPLDAPKSLTSHPPLPRNIERPAQSQGLRPQDDISRKGTTQEAEPWDRTGVAPGQPRYGEQGVGSLHVPAEIPPQNGSRRLQKPQPGSEGRSVVSGATGPVFHEAPQQTSKQTWLRTAGTTRDIVPEPPSGPTISHKYDTPPQSAGGSQAAHKVTFDNTHEPHVESHPHGNHRLSNILHLGHRAAGAPYDTPPATSHRLSEWRTARTARLTADDLLVEDDKRSTNRAWWEGGGTGPQRGSTRKRQSYGRESSDGYVDEYGHTSFYPPLYLKCGPLLRYTGLKRERTSRNGTRGGSQPIDREIWRGSVMIVTLDSDSSYDIAPRLRLFAQPTELFSYPRQAPDGNLSDRPSPEYVDPIAGLPKVSRTGRTLYVKPVEQVAVEVDLSRVEDNHGLFDDSGTHALMKDAAHDGDPAGVRVPLPVNSRVKGQDGEKIGKYKEVKGIRLHAERGVTFWRFNIEVELGHTQACIAYRINRGPAINFWVPAKGESMNIMFHSCNGFSLSVNPHIFSGPDPLWRDVLGAHQSRPFHVMIGGGDQIYNDAVMRQTERFKEWLEIKNPHHKHSAPFSEEMHNELEAFYLERYAMWFSQGFFSMANAQIPMVNIWDDHDIIDGYGSYPHHFMSSPVFLGLGAVAYKYYMLFQHQSVPEETQTDEPSWLLGAGPGPYISELSRSVFMFLGRKIAFLGLDCRTERTRDEILSEQSYDLVFNRCRREIIKGETQHLIVVLGVPIAYPRLVWLENVLTSRLMDPVKALGRIGMFGGFLNQFDGGVEVLDDLDDHWTAKNHKQERNWFIEELQELAAEKSVRITILGGDVHLAAFGQFYSNARLNVPKDRDHRYMPNVISSAIVNTPPPDMLADILNKRNRVHHFDKETDEDMIPIFTHDVDGKPRGNKRLLPRRNWCSIREYRPGATPPPTPPPVEDLTPQQTPPPTKLTRTLSLTRSNGRPGNLMRRISQRAASYSTGRRPKADYMAQSGPSSPDNYFPEPPSPALPREAGPDGDGVAPETRPNGFRRRPTIISKKVAQSSEGEQTGHVNLEGGLDIALNCEVSQKDPAGITVPYRLLVPALWYEGEGDINTIKLRKDNWLKRFSSTSRRNTNAGLAARQGDGNWGGESSDSEGEPETHPEPERLPQPESPEAGSHGQGGGYSGVEAYKEPKPRRKWF